MKKIRILRVITRLNVGGPSIQALDLSTHSLWDTRLVSGTLKPGEESMLWHAEGRKLDHTLIPNLVQPPHPLKDLLALLALWREIRRFGPDLIHTHHAKAGWLGRLAGLISGVPVVHTFHGNVFSGHFGPVASRFYLWAERALAPLAARLIAISALQQRDLVERWKLCDWERTRVIELGFDLSGFPSPLSKEEARRQLGLPGERVLLGMVGRLTHVKNHAFFLEALAKAPPTWNATIVGDGELDADLKARVGTLGLGGRVHFVPTQKDVARVYRALDVLVVPSHSEGTPVAMIEAMASTTPVVAASVGGIPDLAGAREERALLHAPGDTPGFLAAVTRALEGDRARDILARDHVLSRHGSQRLVRDLDALYRELLA